MRVGSFHVPAWVQDLLIALFVCALQLQGTIAKVERDPSSVIRPLDAADHLGYGLLIISGLAIALRRRFPVAVFVVAGLASLAYYTADYPDGPGWVGLFVALYTLTAYGDGRLSLAVAGVGIGLLAVGWLVAAANIEPRAAIGWVFFRIGASVMSAALGESVRSRRVIAADALTRAELAERSAEDEARARVAQERLSIAREVHDTVAHAIAVINVQAGVTAHVLDKRPERVRETLVAIERTSSQALHEMRTILGVLRADDAARAPRPGLGQIGELLDRARASGLDVELNHEPETTVGLPSAVDAAAYRIVQEAVTNVIRHVGPTRVTISLDRGPDALELRVADGGRRGTPVPGPPSAPSLATEAAPGWGIRGMRERCEVLGGQLVVRTRPGAGYEISASLPLVAAEQRKA